MPEFTQKMMMHLNGGSKFSELRFRILSDGKETSVTRVKRTSGSPRYLITVDLFSDGKEEFDVMATRGIGLREWLETHAVADLKSPANSPDRKP